jgi:ribonucleoside-triphosphate reductase
MNNMVVVKRDGTTQEFDFKKIKKAVLMAFEGAIPDLDSLYTEIQARIWESLDDGTEAEARVAVEYIQDLIEDSLMQAGYYDEARRFIKYRADRALVRAERLQPDSEVLGEFVVAAKYARAKSDGYKETYEDIVERNRGMHEEYYSTTGPGAYGIGLDPRVASRLDMSYELVLDKIVLPSMRSMQFAGPAILRNHTRMYNCSGTYIDRMSAFGEVFYLLLCGCGVGISVQFEHTQMLPRVRGIGTRVRHHIIEDTIEGWANAVHQLMFAHFVTGERVEFSYHKIRDEGELLRTSGGLAPGHLPLKRCLDRLNEFLDARAGRKLRPIECFDMICWLAEAVLSGGIRRSSCIAVFSVGDSEMMYAKSPGNFMPGSVNSQRGMCNISAMLVRGEDGKGWSRSVFNRISQEAIDGYGEPGFYFSRHHDVIPNPCGEIGLYCRDSDGISGVGFCNLTEINGAAVEGEKGFQQACVAASVLGTLQAGYTDFRFLGPVSEQIAKEQGLVGVSITGIMDQPDLLLSDGVLRRGRDTVGRINKEVADVIGIKQSARGVTCVKPSGTASLVLGGVGSGIHGHPGRRYFRRITMNRNEPLLAFWKSVNPHMVEQKPDGDYVVTFCVQVGDGSVLQTEQSGLEQLENIALLKQHWVSGDHNVSATVVVKNEVEGRDVSGRIWEYRGFLGGVTMIVDAGICGGPGLGGYSYLPREVVTTAAQERRWNEIISKYVQPDWGNFYDPNWFSPGQACEGETCGI